MSTQPSLLDILTTATPNHGRRPTTSWLLDHLIRAGHVTETGATRRARIRTCPSCHEPILIGLDADSCAIEAHVDPTPLTALGEALAVVEGRWTWALRREGTRYVLDPRDHHDIAWAPAATVARTDVLRAHRCHTDPATGALTAPTSFAEAAPALPADATPPF